MSPTSRSTLHPPRSTTHWIFTLVVGLAAARAAEPPRVPEGFAITVVAAPPVVERPVMANFDDQGRLWVVDSAGVNERFNDLVKNPPHRIVVLADTDHDGKFDQRTLFADKLVMPQGVLPLDGAVYVASPPSVWKLEDTDGDLVCDQRTEIVTEFGSNGNAADIHGPFAGPDGWLYLCDGRHGHKVRRPDGTFDQGLAGGIFRFKPDGSQFERFCGGGFDNPVEIDFTPGGDILGTVNILHGNPRIDALVHWVEGGCYPRADQEQCLAEFPRTGELLPAVSEFGHVAVSGMTRYRHTALGEEFRDNLFITLFNRRKVLRSVVTRKGSTYQTVEEEFVVSDDVDFHPTDVLEDPAGGLLVVDTGGWFRLGCPQSQIAKPDVLGAIYRIQRADALPDACGGNCAELDPEFPDILVKYLDDAPPGIQQRAVRMLGKLGAAALPELRRLFAADGAATPTTRRNAVWALTQIGTPEAADLLAIALKDADATTRQAAAYGLGMIGHPRHAAPLAALLADEDAHVRRATASALGRLCRPEHWSSLDSRTPTLRRIGAALHDGRPMDRMLEHALLYALIQSAAREVAAELLDSEDPVQRRAALIVLDQMPEGGLAPERVVRELEGGDAALRQTAFAVVARHPEWGPAMRTVVAGWLAEPVPPERGTALRQWLGQQAGQPEMQTLIAERFSAAATPLATRLLLGEVMQRATLAEFPARWAAALEQTLGDKQTELARQAIGIIHARNLAQFDDRLAGLAARADAPPLLRLDAWSAIILRRKEVASAQFAFLRQALNDEAPLARLTAAQVLARAPLDDRQLLALGPDLEQAGPLVLPILVRAFARSQAANVGQRLVQALEKTPSAASLNASELAKLLATFPESVQTSAAPLLKTLGGSLADQQARLAELAPLLNDGDPARGRFVFYSQKGACSSCHAVGGLGAAIGPDLTKIGGTRSGRDLLEAVVFPSASLVREYQPYVVVTTAGRSVTGVIARQSVEALELRGADLVEHRVLRSDVEEIVESPVSIMPQGLDRQLTRDELRDLLGFLQSLK